MNEFRFYDFCRTQAPGITWEACMTLLHRLQQQQRERARKASQH